MNGADIRSFAKMIRLIRVALDSAMLGSWLSLVVRSIGLLVWMPLVLSRFDAAEVTVWSLLLTFANLTILADFGFGPSFSRALNYCFAGVTDLKGEDSNASLIEKNAEGFDRSLCVRILSSMSTLYGRLTITTQTTILILGTIVLAVPIGKCRNPLDSWLAWAVVVLSIGVMFWANYFSALFQGLDRIHHFKNTEAFWTGTALLAACLCTFTGLKLAAIMAVYQGFQSIGVLHCWRLAASVKKKLGISTRSSAAIDSEVWAFVWPSAWRHGLGSLSSTFAFHHAPSMFFSQFGEPLSTARLLITTRLMTAANQMSSVPFYAKLPSYIRLFAAGERRRLIDVTTMSMRWVYLIFVALSISLYGLATFGLPVLGIKIVPLDASFWFLMSIGFLLERIGAVNIQMSALGNQIIMHRVNGLTGLVFVLTAVVLFPWAEYWSYPIAIIVANGLCFVPLAILAYHRVFRLSTIRQETASWSWVCLGSLIAIFCLSRVLQA